MSENIDNCLLDRATTGDPGRTLLWVDRWAAPLSHNPEAVMELVDTLSDVDTECTNDCLSLIERILDVARMNDENDEPGVGHFFQVLAAGLAERAEAGQLAAKSCFSLCQTYLRAGLTPPDQLRTAPDALESLAGDEMPELPDVAELAEGLVPKGVTPFETYNALREIVGAMPVQMTTAFLTQMVGKIGPPYSPKYISNSFSVEKVQKYC